jgi:hypothetical protein
VAGAPGNGRPYAGCSERRRRAEQFAQKMEHLPFYLILDYCVLSIFSNYQYNQIKAKRYFKVTKKGLKVFIAGFTVAVIVFQYGFVIYYGYFVKWYYALLLLAIGLISDMAYNWIEINIFRERYARHLFLLSFPVLPVCVYFIISYYRKEPLF